MKKFLLILTCAVSILTYAQSGSTSTGTTSPPDKKHDVQTLQNPGDPVLVPIGGPKKKDLTRTAAAGTWQICSRACWLYGHVVAAAYSWYQPSDVPCGNVSWPDEPVYFCEGYMEHGHVVIADSGWTNGDGMQC